MQTNFLHMYKITSTQELLGLHVSSWALVTWKGQEQGKVQCTLFSVSVKNQIVPNIFLKTYKKAKPCQTVNFQRWIFLGIVFFMWLSPTYPTWIEIRLHLRLQLQVSMRGPVK